MNAIMQTYEGLLADVSVLSGFSEIRGSSTDWNWCLNEAPKLEKYLVSSLERGETLDLDIFPRHLRRLAQGSVVDPLKMRLLRQLLLFSYKAYVPYDKTVTQQSFRNFVATQTTVGEENNSYSCKSPRLLDKARKLVQGVLYRFRESALKPSHGPGSVTNSKEKWQSWFEAIDYLYPYSDWMYLYYNRDHLAESEDGTRPSHISTKLIAVPKDSRGPRLICVHPAESIWIQQGLRRELERAISLRGRPGKVWPCGHINFDDQTVNGTIALKSSQSGLYATIDLKEASDRIPESLVQILFGRKYKYFGCCRAQKYIIKGGLQDCENDPEGNFVDDISCYAPMGNATTFPVQSLVFWAICVASMQLRGFHQPNAAFVFGDDIEIPSECAESVIDDLESFGLLVNKEKSFWRGSFRESCGVDAFKGINVTPIRWKTSPDSESLSELVGVSDMAMRLRIAGYHCASIAAYSILRRRMKTAYGKDLFITNNPHHGGICEYSSLGSLAWRDAFWHRSWQKFVTPVYGIEPPSRKKVGLGWNQVLESVCSLERTGHGETPDRAALRRSRLSVGSTDVL